MLTGLPNMCCVESGGHETTKNATLNERAPFRYTGETGILTRFPSDHIRTENITETSETIVEKQLGASANLFLLGSAMNARVDDSDDGKNKKKNATDYEK
ncbi:hypothetical protein BTUL_0020g00530 [Botrytis tulipae]|uniref:Uncharacterized protein n=1 Tax=Botrytis tulipae TaxID=87230 RepID=A0A4Z1F7E1_9HELO|nr:hypothetical protein BTUL_0020g00530 [Botrytis tulipae]